MVNSVLCEGKAYTVTERIERYWIVKTKGAEQMSIRPGSSVEVGRKPLRALSDDGFVRLEVMDSTRSMSKRHAIISVTRQGGALVRDLNSTNGSYIVGSDGGLKRLTPGDEFLLPGSPVRMQFGDVPIDFIRVDEPVEHHEEPAVEVPNLFDYAAADVKQEPDAADMSVDDILNLRAGEPTTAFRRSSVAHRVNEITQAAATSYPPEASTDEQGHASSAVQAESARQVAEPVQRAESGVETAGAMAQPDVDQTDVDQTNVEQSDVEQTDTVQPVQSQSQSQVQPIHSPAPAQTQPGQAPSSSSSTSGEQTVGGADAQEDRHPIERLSLNFVAATSDRVEKRDLFVDALSEPEQSDMPDDAVQPERTIAVQTVFGGHAPQSIDRLGGTNVGSADATVDATVDDAAHDDAAHDDAEHDEAAPNRTVDEDGKTPTASVQAVVHPVAENGRAIEPVAGAETVAGVAGPDPESSGQGVEPDSTAVFTPAFEPGSVFERVKQGEFRTHEPAVEVDGLTSDQAKATADFTEQFEIARHPQLLPFLAMNPSLYDDLYAWLAAQGNKDIDAALAKNAGYDEYRTAVGK